MFYIDKAGSKGREILFFHVIPTSVVFIAFAIATIFNWSSARNNVNTEHSLILNQYNREVITAVQQRVDVYENIIRTAASVFGFNSTISKEDWASFVSSLDIETRYPGLQAVGFIQIIPGADYDSHVQSVRTTSNAAYSIYPEGQRDIYSSVRFIEPFTDTTSKIIGYDMLTDSARKVVMENASSNGTVVMSDVVQLRQDQMTDSEHTGFLLFAPFYKDVLTSEPPAPSAVRGFVYAPFRSSLFVEKTLGTQKEHYSFILENVHTDGQQLLYEATRYNEIRAETNSKQLTNEVKLLGKTWRLTGVATSDVVDDVTRARPVTTLVGGLVFSAIVAGFVYLLLSNRTRILTEKEQKSIQEAKDELLALASHQLRTPATGVKQYVGLLRQGFAGELDETQKVLLDKAYESNERQLDTINEMLFVARADAGQLKMDTSKLDLSELLNELIEEQQTLFLDKNQSLTTSIPATSQIIRGDKPYLRMALENIITNASKYTPENGTISVKLKKHDSVIVVQITDNGIGVDKKDQDLLFKKFSRIQNELTGRVSGSGIGLYLTKKIIDAHHGKILFQSEKGKGSEITILLPRDDSSRQ